MMVSYLLNLTSLLCAAEVALVLLEMIAGSNVDLASAHQKNLYYKDVLSYSVCINTHCWHQHAGIDTSEHILVSVASPALPPQSCSSTTTVGVDFYSFGGAYGQGSPVSHICPGKPLISLIYCTNKLRLCN